MATIERPILMNAFSMQAYLAGRKTQTRRVIKPSWSRCLDLEDMEDRLKALQQCPYGQTGDHLWFREAWALAQHVTLGFGINGARDPETGQAVMYRATFEQPLNFPEFRVKWSPSIFMPRWASRCCPEILNIRVERVQDISAMDALAEGCPAGKGALNRRTIEVLGTSSGTGLAAIEWFAELWDSINARRGWGWDVNPWVWVVAFPQVASAAAMER